MIRRHDITYSALRVEAVRVSMEVFDDGTDPGNSRHRPGRSSADARSAPADMPAPTCHDECSRIIDWRDGS